MWLKIVSTRCCVLLYIWTCVAPAIFPDRDFSWEFNELMQIFLFCDFFFFFYFYFSTRPMSRTQLWKRYLFIYLCLSGKSFVSNIISLNKSMSFFYFKVKQKSTCDQSLLMCRANGLTNDVFHFLIQTDNGVDQVNRLLSSLASPVANQVISVDLRAL